MISREDVLAAREAIGGRLHRTPLFSSRALSERIGAEAHLKAELFQRTGSFKPRGMLVKVVSLSADEKSRGIVTWSAGNAGQGAAYAASLSRRRLPRLHVAHGEPTARSRARCRTARRSTSTPDGPAEAHERLLAFVEKTGAIVRSPVRRPRAPGRPRVTRTGDPGRRGRSRRRSSCRSAGGGLISGIASAVSCRVVGVEPEGCADAHRRARRRPACRDPAPVDRGRARRRRSPESTRSPSSAIAWTRSCSSPRTRSPRGCGFSTAARSLPASRPGQPRRAPCWPARSRSTPGPRSSPSCREATRTRRSLLLSSPRPDED